MAFEVKWRVPGLFKADAKKVYEEIGTEGTTPEAMIEKARDENTELHKCFEWDDTKAAERWRIQQARIILSGIVVVPVAEEETPRRVFEISSVRNVYKPVQFFKQNLDEYQVLLKRAAGELKSIRNRYNNIVELDKVFEAIDEL